MYDASLLKQSKVLTGTSRSSSKDFAFSLQEVNEVLARSLLIACKVNGICWRVFWYMQK